MMWMLEDLLDGIQFEAMDRVLENGSNEVSWIFAVLIHNKLATNKVTWMPEVKVMIDVDLDDGSRGVAVHRRCVDGERRRGWIVGVGPGWIGHG